MPPGSSAVEVVSRAVGVSVTTLERWRADALSNAGDWRGGSGRPWTARARLESVIAVTAMDEPACSVWCREHGLNSPELDDRKQDIGAGLGGPRAARDGSTPEGSTHSGRRPDGTLHRGGRIRG